MTISSSTTTARVPSDKCTPFEPNPWQVNGNCAADFDQHGRGDAKDNEPATEPNTYAERLEDGSYALSVKLIAGEENTLVSIGTSPAYFLHKADKAFFDDLAFFLQRGYKDYLHDAKHGDNAIDEERLLQERWNRVREFYLRMVKLFAVADDGTKAATDTDTV